MAGGKLPPRQKMIGMMYLVLTALLAMNVSKDILDAFILINDGLENTNTNFEAKNEYIYNAFEKAKMNDPIKVTPYWKKAQQAKRLADELDLHLEQLKKYLIRETDKKPPEVMPDDSLKLNTTESKDNYDIPTHILIGEPATPKDGPNTARELKEKVKLFREDLLNLIEDPVTKAAMNIGLSTEDFGQNASGDYESWETGWFYHVPLAAVITAMSKIQSDVRNAEGDIIKTLYQNISADDFKFDTLAAKVIPSSKIVFIGEEYKADVIVAAYSTTVDPLLEIGDVDSSGKVKNPDTTGISINRGLATFSTKPRTEGKVEWGGVIKIKKPDGSYQPYPFNESYLVMKPALVVSPTAMNLFYRGIDNPVEIAVSGVAPEKLKVSMNNGSISGTKGKFTVRPGNDKECVISVSADMDGKIQRFGEQKFRVKNVPDPRPMFAGSAGGNVPMNNLKAASGVIAKLENFEFEGVKFEVVSFTMTALVKGNLVSKEGKGSTLTADMKTLVNALKGNQKLYIEDVKARGPDGSVRSLGSIVIKAIG